MLKKYKIIFLGTNIFSLNILQILLKLKKINLIAVVTQPDKKKDRKKNIIFSPIKEFLMKSNLLFFQPNKIIDIYDDIKKLNPDIILTCAYGQFLPEKILNLPNIFPLNIHASLLPKLRGGAPIHWAIILGEKKTGISIIKMDKKMDSGEIFYQKEILININDTFTSLEKKLILLTNSIIENKLIKIIENKFVPIKQNENLVTYAFNLNKNDRKINWNDNKLNIYNKIRGLNSYPVAYSTLNNKIYKIYESIILEDELNFKDINLNNGTIVDINKKGIKIKIKDGYLSIIKLKKEGKNIILANNFYKNFNNNDIKINNYFL